MSVRKTPTQQRGFETVQKILKNSAVLFASNGYEATSTRHIAAQANVPIGTIYQFFSDKKDILTELANNYSESLESLFEQLSNTNVEGFDRYELIEAILQTVLTFDKENPECFLIFNFSQATTELRESINKLDIKIVNYGAKLFQAFSKEYKPEKHNIYLNMCFKTCVMLLLKSKEMKTEKEKKEVYKTMFEICDLYFRFFFGVTKIDIPENMLH